MRFEVGNEIIVYEPTEDFMRWCDESLVLANPEFEKKSRMGLWTGNTPRKLFLYERRGSEYAVPFGCFRELYRRYGSESSFKSRISPSERFSYQSNINLYPYQENAIQKLLEARNGILVMPCGSGKTMCGMEIIARLGLRTLWLTHTQDLLNQSLNCAKSVLSCDNSSYGTITGGKVNIGSGITFATVQTMSKLDLSRYKDVWGCVVVDEAHHAVGTPTKAGQFYKVLSALSCRYKFGLTATPKRADGMQRAMTALLGDIVYEVSREDVAHTTCPVEVVTVETGYFPNLDMALSGDGTINYAGLVDDLIHDERRTELVAAVVNSLDGSSMVLGNRIEYLKQLQERFTGKSICLSALGSSKSAKKQRKDALIALNSGTIDCIFATYQLAAEGLNCPNLEYVVLATPEKDERIIMQSTGRVTRKSDGKTKGVVIDFEDCFGMLCGWQKKRKRIYKKLGYDIK